jgi:hypothetical protein
VRSKLLWLLDGAFLYGLIGLSILLMLPFLPIVAVFEFFSPKDDPNEWYRAWRLEEIRKALLKGKVPRGFEDCPPEKLR